MRWSDRLGHHARSAARGRSAAREDPKFRTRPLCAGYGLTDAGLAAAREKATFGALIAVDCGSPSVVQLERLRQAEIPTLVIYHHDTAEPGIPHPATVHFNPKDLHDDTPHVARLRAMSAAGLAFVVADAFASAGSLTWWNRERAIILAGLGTLVDVMPLTGFNRILVKHSLHLAARSGLEQRVPGLWALKKVAQTGRVDEETYGFQWGPRLNAAGRLDDANLALGLLCSTDPAAALAIAEKVAGPSPDAIAKSLDRTNQTRKEIQAGIHEQARAMALEQLKRSDPPKILVLHNPSWHTGVVGIVASKIREEFCRPSIVFGQTPDSAGPWKGSGRSIPEYDLGAAVRDAVGAGVIPSGGGHRMAAGFSAANENQVAALSSQLNFPWNLPDTVLTPTAEILGSWDARRPEQCWPLLDQLRPLGQGNPKPHFSAFGLAVQKLEAKKSGYRITFTSDSGKKLAAWSSEAGWVVGTAVPTLLLELGKSVMPGGKVCYNWSIAGRFASS